VRVEKMSQLRSELQICCDLNIVTYAQWVAHNGSTSSLIHTVKEMGSILIDQRLNSESLLSRRLNIHGADFGIKPSEIFTEFMPFDSTLIRYAEFFGLFTKRKIGNRTVIIPLLETPPDISHLVEDPKSFHEEAVVLGKLNFYQKNVLATHRNLEMTSDAHRTVARLFLNFSKLLIQYLDAGQIDKINETMNTMNECADELVKKSGFYPRYAVSVKKELGASNNNTLVALANKLEIHDKISNKIEPSSLVICRGSHLVRSLLFRINLYKAVSNSVIDEKKKFLDSLNLAKIDPLPERDLEDIRKLVIFLQKIALQFVWWGA